MPSVLLCQGTALQLPLKDASVHTVCTSPPYYNLRSYGCGPGELGMETSPEAYIAAMVQVFREVKRVLHPLGTLFCNMGDSYNAAGRNGHGTRIGYKQGTNRASATGQDACRPQSVVLGEKQLLGMPWKLAFALQADGWILRSEIIWHKLNCMPESVQDRPTRAHEQVFLFSKQAHYHYDAMAVREPAQDWGLRDRTHFKPNTDGIRAPGHPPHHGLTNANGAVAGRNMRSVLSLPSEPTPYAHFATMPQALVRRCLLAGAPSQVCAACHAPYRRVVERQAASWHSGGPKELALVHAGIHRANGRLHGPGWRQETAPHTTTHGWQPTCPCAAGVGKAVVLDPFVGSGTTLLVARELGHHAIGVDLSWNYLSTIARQRLGLAALAAWQGHGAPPPAEDYTALPLFGGG